jgi:hypothetical protein
VFLEQRFNVKRRVAGSAIDQHRVQKRPHDAVPCLIVSHFIYLNDLILNGTL